MPELQNLVVENESSANAVLFIGEEAYNGSNISIDVEVGTQYKVVLDSDSAMFSEDSQGTVSEDGLTITGTITNLNNNSIKIIDKNTQ